MSSGRQTPHPYGNDLDIGTIVEPAAPSVGTRRLFVDQADGKLKVKRSDGVTVSLEEQGGSVDHNLLSATHLDVLVAAVLRGDIIIGNLTPKWSRLAIGTSGKFLRTDGTDPSWQLLVAADVPDLDAAKITTGTFAVARGGTGLATIAAGGILYSSALDTLARIAASAANQVLRSTAANVLEIAALVAADIPNLDAAKITSGRFTAARLLDGAVAYYLRGGGAGVDPAYAQPLHSELGGVTSNQHHAQLHKASHVSGGGDAFVASDQLDGIFNGKIMLTGATNKPQLVGIASPDAHAILEPATGNQWIGLILRPGGSGPGAGSPTAGIQLEYQNTPLTGPRATWESWVFSDGQKAVRFLYESSDTTSVPIYFCMAYSGVAWGGGNPVIYIDTDGLLKLRDMNAGGVTREPTTNITLRAFADILEIRNEANNAYRQLHVSSGGLGKALAPTWTNDYILVYKTATDDWRMEAKGTPAAHADTHKSGGTDAFLSSDLLEAVVKRLQESSGPTNMTLGAVADGEYLKRSASTIIGGTPGGGDSESIWFPAGTTKRCVTFPPTNLSVGGDTGAGSSPSSPLSFQRYTGAVAGRRAWITSAINSTNEPAGGSFQWFNKNPQFETSIMFPSVADMVFWLCFGGTSGTPGTVTERKFGIYISAAALYSVSSDGTAQSTLDLTTVLSAGVWYLIRCKLVSSTAIQVWVNGVAKTNKTTNVPSNSDGNVNREFYGHIVTNVATSKGFFIQPIRLMWDA